MNLKEYAKKTRFTDQRLRWGDEVMEVYPNELHYLMGLMTEVGELVDIYKKGIMYDRETEIEHISRDKIEKEIGDILWYLTRFVDITSLDFDTILTKNVTKLKKRFPKGFNGKDARQQVDAKK